MDCEGLAKTLPHAPLIAGNTLREAAGQKKVQESAHVPAGIGCCGTEKEKKTCADSCTNVPVFQGFATDRTGKQGLRENQPLAEAGLEPARPYGQGILNP